MILAIPACHSTLPADAERTPDAATAAPGLPHLTLEYSYTLDAYCTREVVPETLPAWGRTLIDHIPVHRVALVQELPRLQSAWDAVERDLLAATVRVTGHTFERKELTAALFLCPRLPSMGTPLAINTVSFLESTVPDVPTLVDLDGDGDRDPLPTSLFVAITFHEIMHKYLLDVADFGSTAVIQSLPPELTSDLTEREVQLLRAHLHLFAVRRSVYEDLGLASQFPLVGALEKTHGPGYARAWELVHVRTGYYERLLDEVRAAP